jgi:hypothetical protein
MPSYAFRPFTRRCRILDTLVAMLYGRYALSCVIGCLPIEVTGQLSVVNGLDVEKTIETEYDRWVRLLDLRIYDKLMNLSGSPGLPSPRALSTRAKLSP